MTSYLKLFSSSSPCACNKKKKVKIADGSLFVIAEIGYVQLFPSLILHNVLHVSNLPCNVPSINKITFDHKCHANFYPLYCEFHN